MGFNNHLICAYISHVRHCFTIPHIRYCILFCRNLEIVIFQCRLLGLSDDSFFLVDLDFHHRCIVNHDILLGKFSWHDIEINSELTFFCIVSARCNDHFCSANFLVVCIAKREIYFYSHFIVHFGGNLSVLFYLCWQFLCFLLFLVTYFVIFVLILYKESKTAVRISYNFNDYPLKSILFIRI